MLHCTVNISGPRWEAAILTLLKRFIFYYLSKFFFIIIARWVRLILCTHSEAYLSRGSCNGWEGGGGDHVKVIDGVKTILY